MFSFIYRVIRLIPSSLNIYRRSIFSLYRSINTRSVKCPIYALLPAQTLIAPGTLIYSQVAKVDVEENIGEMLSLVKNAIDRGELEKAEAILEMGIKICEEYQSYYALPYMYDILASIALTTGKIAKAENIFVRVIEKMIQLEIPDNNDQIIDFKLRLSRIYSIYKEEVLAEIGFSSCLKEQENKINNGDVSARTGLLYINCLFFYGLHKISISDYIKAKTFVDMAYSYAMKVKGLSPYQEMTILGTLAELNTELKDYDIAIQNIVSAIILGKGIGSVDLPKMYLKLAKIYIKMDSNQIAEEWLNESMKLANLFNDKKIYDEAQTLLQTINP